MRTYGGVVRRKTKKKGQWIGDDAKRVPGNRAVSSGPQARQKPAHNHNPAGVSYACLPVAVVRTGRRGEDEVRLSQIRPGSAQV